jgi:hypothetical protein
MKEKWKDIDSHKGIYKVSNLGRVRRVIASNTGKAGMILSPINERYQKVGLWKRGRMTPSLIHRLVATAFVINPRNKKTVNHKDGNRYNNISTNLEWVTPSENMMHAKRVLLIGCGNNHYCSRLREIDIPAIIRLRRSGWVLNRISKRFGVHESTIRKIVAGLTWVYSRPNGYPLVA